MVRLKRGVGAKFLPIKVVYWDKASTYKREPGVKPTSLELVPFC